MKNKTVFITGICGFLGSHLAESLLKEGYKVLGVDNLLCGDLENLPEGADFFKLDCRNYDKMNSLMAEYNVDIVVHAAATAAEGFSVFSPSFITRNIYEASVAVFGAAINNKVERIIYMSSMSRYGHGEPFGPPFKEDVHSTAPVDPYAIAKVAAEQTLVALCTEHDINWSILVPHNIIGTRQEVSAYRNVVSIFINRILMGMPIYVYGDGLQERSFSPVSDCLDCLMASVEGAGDGQVINIGPDSNEISINKLIEICFKATGRRTEVIYLPPRPITDNVKFAYCSSDKARRLLGYKQQQDLVMCIMDMVSEFKTKEFDYGFPVEINSPKLPKTWKEKLQ